MLSSFIDFVRFWKREIILAFFGICAIAVIVFVKMKIGDTALGSDLVLLSDIALFCIMTMLGYNIGKKRK